MKRPRIVIYRDEQGLYRFRPVAANGEIVADNYASVRDARRGVSAARRVFRWGRVVIEG
jgi:uncharacterized protein YegP (UPF0339 family)